MNYDIVLKNGKIVDGTGNPWYKANVGIESGRILAISRKELGEANRVIDADGLIIAPGFINPHGHFDRFLHEDNAVLQSVMQGLTIECTGNCGMAVYAMSEAFSRHLQEFSDQPIDWLTLEEWRQKLETQGLGLNIAAFLGFGTIRSSAMGEEGEGGERFKPNPEELQQMKTLCAQGMMDGAFGITVGLSYQVQRNASTAEIIELTKVAAEHGGVFMSHARGGVGSTLEFIEICEKTPIPGCLSHATLAANRISLAQFQDARQRGVEIVFDLYPWIHGSGKNLGFWLFGHQLMKKQEPLAWRFWNIKDLNDPFFEQVAERLKNEIEWRKVKTAAIERMQLLTKENLERSKALETTSKSLNVPPIWDVGDRAGIVYSPSHPEFEGDDTTLPTSLAEAAKVLGSPDIWEAARQIFIDDKGKTLVVNLAPKKGGRKEKDVIASYQLQGSIVSSDASHFITHPRGWGSWPKVLQRYVRELNVLSLEEAVRKMTSLPAQFLGLKDRGLLRVGMWADIVAFNQDKIMNKATYQSPRQYPEGINYVLVNGEIVAENGKHTGALPGKVLRRQ